MKNILNWFTRRVVFVASLFGVGILFALTHVEEYYVCQSLALNFDSGCTDFFSGLFNSFIIFLPVLGFSVFTRFLNDEVFRYWSRFTLVAVVTFFLLVLLSSDHDGGTGWWPAPSTRETALYLGLVLYSIVSLYFFIIKSLLASWGKVSDDTQSISGVSRKRMFLAVFVFTEFLFLFLYIVFAASMLLSGNSWGGLTLTSEPTFLGFVQLFFGSYILSLLGEIFAILMLGIFMGGEGVFILLFFLVPVLAGVVISAFITKIVFKFGEPRKALNFFKIISYALAGVYVLVALTHFVVVPRIESWRRGTADEFKKAYGVDNFLPHSKYIYFNYSSNGTFLDQNVSIVVADLNGTVEKTLFTVSENAAARIGQHYFKFPSPQGKYYIVNSKPNDSNISENIVKSLDGQYAFVVPFPFNLNLPGAALWSKDDRFLAIFSDMLATPLGPGVLTILDVQSKKTIASIGGSVSDGFKWGDDGYLYYSCENQVCRINPDSSTLISEKIENVVNCLPFVILGSNLYCAVKNSELLRFFGIETDPVDLSFMGVSEAKDPFYLISQKLNSSYSQKEAVLVSKIPVVPQKLFVIDDNHLLSFGSTENSLEVAIVTEISSGKVKYLSVSDPIFQRIMYGYIPTIFTGDLANLPTK